MTEITTEMIEQWLGTSNPEQEAIETLADLANGDYKLEQFAQDVVETVEQ